MWRAVTALCQAATSFPRSEPAGESIPSKVLLNPRCLEVKKPFPIWTKFCHLTHLRSSKFTTLAPMGGNRGAGNNLCFSSVNKMLGAPSIKCLLSL